MTVNEYSAFADKCCEELEILQDSFKLNYGLDWYEDWYHVQDAGVFYLQKDNTKLHFNYLIVGSFSTKSNTWKWSWDNPDISARVRLPMHKVQQFGNDNNIDELHTGLFPAEEYLGWKFTAIAAKLLHAIAAYRVTSGNLHTYMLLLKEVSEQYANLMTENVVECNTHSAGWASFVCQHLNTLTKNGFNVAFVTSPDLLLEPGDSFQAWCNDCEAERLKDGEWNDRSEAFAKIKLVCSGCYFDIKEHNLGSK